MRYRAARSRCSWKMVFDTQWGYKMRARARRLYVKWKVEMRRRTGDGRSACSPVRSSTVQYGPVRSSPAYRIVLPDMPRDASVSSPSSYHSKPAKGMSLTVLSGEVEEKGRK